MNQWKLQLQFNAEFNSMLIYCAHKYYKSTEHAILLLEWKYFIIDQFRILFSG